MPRDDNSASCCAAAVASRSSVKCKRNRMRVPVRDHHLIACLPRIQRPPLRIVGRPNPERRFQPAIRRIQIGHRLSVAANPMRPPIVGQRIVVRRPKPRQVRQQVRHKPAKLRQLAHRALRQLQRFVLPRLLERMPALRQSQAKILLRRITRHHQRPQLCNQRIRNKRPDQRGRPLGKRTERRRIANHPLFMRNLRHRLIVRHRFHARLAQPNPSARESTRCDTYRYRSASESQRRPASAPATPAQNSCTTRPDETAPADAPTRETARPPATRVSATDPAPRDTGRIADRPVEQHPSRRRAQIGQRSPLHVVLHIRQLLTIPRHRIRQRLPRRIDERLTVARRWRKVRYSLARSISMGSNGAGCIQSPVYEHPHRLESDLGAVGEAGTTRFEPASRRKPGNCPAFCCASAISIAVSSTR